MIFARIVGCILGTSGVQKYPQTGKVGRSADAKSEMWLGYMVGHVTGAGWGHCTPGAFTATLPLPRYGSTEDRCLCTAHWDKEDTTCYSRLVDRLASC